MSAVVWFLFFSDSWSRCLDLSLFYFSQHALWHCLNTQQQTGRKRYWRQSWLTTLTAFFLFWHHNLGWLWAITDPPDGNANKSPKKFFMPLRMCSSKSDNSVIIYSSFCYSKPALPSSFYGTQKEMWLFMLLKLLKGQQSTIKVVHKTCVLYIPCLPKFMSTFKSILIGKTWPLL